MTGLLIERADGVLTLTLNRPSALNALTKPLLADLTQALETAADPAIRAVVITGAGRAFCAGQDLQELRDDPGTSYEEVFARYIPILTAIRRLAKPVVAALNGVAAGGGLGLALACDLRVASSDAILDAAFVKVGLVPDSGLTYILPRLVGPSTAFELLALPAPLNADESLRRGLVNRVWPAGGFREEVTGFAAALARGPTLAYGLLKEALDGTWDRTFEEALAVEGRLQGRAGASADHQEGLAAFRERRRPDFRGI